MKKLRVLIICHEYPPMGGGGGVIVRQLANELKHSYDVDVLTAGLEQRDSIVDEGGVRVRRLGVVGRRERAAPSVLSNLTFPLKARRALRELRTGRPYDVISTWFAIPGGPVGMWAQDMLRVPNVLSLLGADVYDPTRRVSGSSNFVFRCIVRKVAHTATVLTACSTDLAKRAYGMCGVNRQIEIVPLGLAPPEALPEPDRLSYGWTEEDTIIASVGRLVARKDYPTLVKAVAAIEDHRIKLVIVGDGPQRKSLARLVEELGVAERVKLMGFVPEEQKLGILRSSDIFALVSRHEGFGICFLEAMYCGLPLIVSNVGGQLDFVKDGVNGAVVPVGDQHALVSHIGALANDKRRRKQIGETNREEVRELMIDKMAARYSDIFERISIAPCDSQM